MAPTTQDYFLEATYEDGFVYRGNRTDASLFVAGKNQFHDVEKKLLEPEHGRLVNWAVVSTQGTRYDLDMRLLPDNARVILYKELERDLVVDTNGNIISDGAPRLMRTVFGAQWNDEAGENHKLTEPLD